MKKFLSILAFAAAVFVTAACNGTAEKDVNLNDMLLALSPDSLVVKAAGGEASFSFTAPDYWFANCPDEWVTIDPYSGKPGEVNLTVKVAENTDTQKRSTLITVNAKTQKGQIKLIQEAGNGETPPPPGPDYSGTWTVIGTIDGSNWDKDFEMTDKGDLVWEATIPYHTGNEFKFRMDADWTVNMGLDGDLAQEGDGYAGAMKQDGANIALPAEGYWTLTLDMNELKMTAFLTEEFPPDNPPLEDGVLWNEETAFDNWSATIVIPAERFADAKEGDIIRVYFKDKTGDFNPIFKHVEDWSDWNELQGGMAVEDEYFEAAIPAGALAELKEKGLRFQGVGFTITKVTLEAGNGGGGDDNVLWDEETAFDSWSATIVIPAEKFVNAEEGDIIRVYFKDKTGDFNPIFKHVEDWSDWTELQGGLAVEDEYFEAAIPAEALDELKAKGLRFQGVGFTIVKVTLEAGSGGGGSDENILWDTETAFDSWSATIVIPAEKFADANEGDIIRVYFKDKTGDFNPIFKHVDDWSDWTELQGGMAVEEEYFEAAIPAEALDELKAKGLRFQGVGFTIVKVTLEAGSGGGPTEIILWDEETAFDSWSTTIVIPAEKFAEAQENDIIHVCISGKGDDFNPIFKHVDDWSDWAELQDAKVVGEDYFEAAIPASALEELQAKGLRFQGVGFTITKVVLL